MADSPHFRNTDALHTHEQHTCWEGPRWDGTMLPPGQCKGCDEAAQHPCRYCGYGHVFTTHNDLAHADNGDPNVPDDPDDAWTNAPHVTSRP